jgi:hypothetical protein
MALPLIPLAVAAARAFGVSAGAARAGGLAYSAFKHRGLVGAISGDEDPRAIIMAARDESVPAEDVRLRARRRSRTGRLIEAVERELAKRPASATGSVVEGIRSVFG